MCVRAGKGRLARNSGKTKIDSSPWLWVALPAATEGPRLGSGIPESSPWIVTGCPSEPTGFGGSTTKVGLGDPGDLFPLKLFHESPCSHLIMGSEALRCQFEQIFLFFLFSKAAISYL